jgi:hypothetical protein
MNTTIKTSWIVEANVHAGACGEFPCQIKTYKIDLSLTLPITVKREEYCYHVTLEMILTAIPELRNELEVHEFCYSENTMKPHNILWSLNVCI